MNTKTLLFVLGIVVILIGFGTSEYILSAIGVGLVIYSERMNDCKIVGDTHEK